MILAIETSTQICSVSYQNEQGEIFEKRTERKGSHSELLFLFIREMMRGHTFSLNELDALLVGTGPGSYTGLRIAASAVKGLLFGLEVPVYAGNTLAGFAQQAGEGRTHAVINARRKHLYHQLFEHDGTLKAIAEPQILELPKIEEQILDGDKLIGTGMERLREEVQARAEILDTSNITSKGLLNLFNSNVSTHFFTKTDAEELESNYLSSSQVNNSRVG
jgi:tRNA threonylcarbamoyl adenosine modification protein YeaZ